MESTLENYQKVYQMLEDAESKDIYINRLNYLISGDFAYMAKSILSYVSKALPHNGKTMGDLLKELPEGRQIVLYGAGSDGRAALPFFSQDKRFIGFCSETKWKQRDGYMGYSVLSPQELLKRKDLSVVVSTSRAREEILKILKDGDYPEDLIFDPAALGCIWCDPEQYFSLETIRYEDEEIFLDVGCCDLNSSLDFKKHCPNLKKIYAFEPEPENYKRCIEKKERFHLEEVEVLPYGAWSRKDVLYFDAQGSGTSTIVEKGTGISIPVINIDEIVPEKEKATFIKMDIEGSELEALKGARRTIQRHKPKLAICIYHKPEDMVEIPLYIKSLVSEYRFYIRHYSNWVNETVLYAMP